MKKLLIIALVLITSQINAQDKKADRMVIKKERLEKLNAKEMAQLQTKRMVLSLDLSEDQQKQVNKLNFKNSKLRIESIKKRIAAREKSEKPSHEERLKMKNERLDAMIATKREMKKILNEEQYKKWSKSIERKANMKNNRKKEYRRKAKRLKRKHREEHRN